MPDNVNVNELIRNLNERIERLETARNTVSGALRILCVADDINEDLSATMLMLADVLEHPEVLS